MQKYEINWEWSMEKWKFALSSFGEGEGVKLKTAFLSRKNDSSFVHHFPKVNQRIAHSSQRRIDADVGYFGDFFETHIAIHTHVKHFPLVIGEVIDQRAHVVMDLLSDDLFFDTGVEQPDGAEDVEIFAAVGNGHPFIVAVTVDG